MNNSKIYQEISIELSEILKGLTSKHKSIASKYFYDDKGSQLFEQIMDLPEYYLTAAESDILKRKSNRFFSGLQQTAFDLIELGAGDGRKTHYILDYLIQNQLTFKYLPIDISQQALNDLQANLNSDLAKIEHSFLQGDYFKLLHKLDKQSNRPKVILFLGSSIGNYSNKEAALFIQSLAASMRTTDRLIVGFDLVKNHDIILNAYNDSQGITAEFNYNLLLNLNTQFGFDFQPKNFIHYPVYNPKYQRAESYLISTCRQEINCSTADIKINIEQYESVFTEQSQKYSLTRIQEIIKSSGLSIQKALYDSNKYYTNIIFTKEN